MAYGTTSKGSDGLPLGSVQVPGQANTTPLQGSNKYTDSNSNDSAPGVMAISDLWKPTYSVAITNQVPVTTAGDCFVLNGSASKVIRLISVFVSGTATTATTLDITLVRRSTADSAGTSTTPTIVTHDTNNAAATATVKAYTVAPTAGTLVGILRSAKLLLAVPAASGGGAPVLWEFGDLPEQCPVLRGVAQSFAVTISAIPTGGSMDICMEFTEE